MQLNRLNNIQPNSMPFYNNPIRLTRTFVETGDERCPIAGIWSQLIGFDPLAEDPELARPAMGRILSWRAIYSIPTNLRYSTAC
jgi:hypothetical protein